jgi:light-regulated signal transduction histidine kinase (bacteriophytochrome)
MDLTPSHSLLRDQNAALEVLVAERTRELADMVKELESFTYSVAHDLRAPLRAINSFSRVLSEDYAERFDGEPMAFLQRICRASERMSQLIDDLLKLSRVGRGEVERRAVNLSKLITEIAARVAERDAMVDGRTTRDVRLEIEPDVMVAGDARLLTVAFENLIDNAYKFTRFCDHAVIRFDTTSQDGSRVIRVVDNGTGFDMRYRHKLFAPFQRLHREDQFEGTGIGLVTVARIVARHGGKVSIEGVEGQGATVSLVLPAAELPA